MQHWGRKPAGRIDEHQEEMINNPLFKINLHGRIVIWLVHLLLNVKVCVVKDPKKDGSLKEQKKNKIIIICNIDFKKSFLINNAIVCI